MNKKDWERRGINDGMAGTTGPFVENDKCWQAKAYWNGHAHGRNAAKALVDETVTREGKILGFPAPMVAAIHAQEGLSKDPVDPNAPRTTWAGKSPFEIYQDLEASTKELKPHLKGIFFTIPDMSDWPQATKAHAEALMDAIYMEGATPRRERLLGKLRILEFRYTKAAPKRAY